MLDDLPLRKPRGHLLTDLGKEDLSDYAVEELRERVQALHDEIDRAESLIKTKESGRNAADALFQPRP